MTERDPLENAFGLRWLEDPAAGEFKSPAEAIQIRGLGCEEAALRERMDRFPPHLRIHGGYTPVAGDPSTRFALTWEPGAREASFAQTTDGDEEGMSGRVDVPPGGALKDVLMDLLVPDAQDVVEQAREEGKKAAFEDVDFWIGERHFRLSDGDRTAT